jgi:hypothetical protein
MRLSDIGRAKQQSSYSSKHVRVGKTNKTGANMTELETLRAAARALLEKFDGRTLDSSAMEVYELRQLVYQHPQRSQPAQRPLTSAASAETLPNAGKDHAMDPVKGDPPALDPDQNPKRK